MSSCATITYPTFYKQSLSYDVHYPDTTVSKSTEVYADVNLFIGAYDGANYVYAKKTNMCYHSSTAPVEVTSLDKTPYKRVSYKVSGQKVSATVAEITPIDIDAYMKVYGYVVAEDISGKVFPVFKYTDKKKVVNWYFPLLVYGLVDEPHNVDANINNIYDMKMNKYKSPIDDTVISVN